MAAAAGDIRSALICEHERLLKRVAAWRTETATYRWLNIVFFMLCKLVVPTGALIVAIDMIGIVVGEPFLKPTAAAVIAVIVTFLASLEAMLNPGAKKRLAFCLNNELASIEYKLCLARISDTDEELQKSLSWANDELKRLLNHYSENGY